MPHMPAMDFSPINSTPVREKEVNQFRESQEIFDKFFKWLFGVIAFKTTAIGEALFITHPKVMMAIVLMIVLYFLVWLLGTMLQQRIGSFVMILVCIILVIGSVSSVLALTIISSLIAWFTSLLWAGIFAVTAYYYYQELYKLIVCAVSDSIKKLIESYKGQCTRLPV